MPAIYPSKEEIEAKRIELEEKYKFIPFSNNYLICNGIYYDDDERYDECSNISPEPKPKSKSTSLKKLGITLKTRSKLSLKTDKIVKTDANLVQKPLKKKLSLNFIKKLENVKEKENLCELNQLKFGENQKTVKTLNQCVNDADEIVEISTSVPKKRKINYLSVKYNQYMLEEKRPKMSVYDYRHQSHLHNNTNSNLGDNGNLATSKDNDDDDNDNTMNNYYQQRLLGGAINSIATLCNIGNSCYLNSVIYTLRFAPQFLHKLHHLVDDMRQVYQKVGQNKLKSSSLGRNVGGLQGQSGRSWSSKDLASLGNNNYEGVSKTNRQIVTEKLHELYQNLHRNEVIDSSEPFHAGNFLHSIQEVSSVFEGNQQQDAHELLMCILDSIRESSHSLIKVISDHPEIISNGCSNALPEQEPTVNPLQNNPQPQHSTMKMLFARKNKRKDSKNGGKPGSPMKTKDSTINSEPQIEPPAIVSSNNNNNTNLSNNNLNNANNSDNISDLNNIPNVDKEKLNEKIKKLGLDFLREDFEGITLSTTKCLTCESINEQKETMIDIAIPISATENSSLIDNPQLYFQNACITREYFRVENHYRCDRCCGYTEAIRSISFDVLPRLLVLHIKRFSGGMEKISSYIPTPFVLKCFCNKCYKKKDDEKLHVYKLYSVITHVGATMSVGHYIAYTCSLPDIHHEYLNCESSKRKFSLSLNNGGNVNNSEKNTGLVKKFIYGRNKASSSGDVTKNLKPINGLSKIMMNGIEKLNLNSANSQNNSNSSSQASSPICHGLNCCGIYVKDAGSSLENHHVNDSDGLNDSPTYNNSNTENHNGVMNGNTNYNMNGKYCNQQTWYQCDDDKIKIMSQKEFEDLLSPNQKVTITPYLLFYARYDLNNVKD